MYHVYVIQSITTKVLYFGRTEDLEQRLKDHNGGRNISTKDKKPWEYVYIESFKSKKDAIERELQLKQYGNARTYTKRRIRHSLS